MPKRSATDPFGATPAWLTNTLIASNTEGIRLEQHTAAAVNGELWYNNGVNVVGTGLITTSNEITGNPALAADGYHLTVGSVAINQGVAAGVTTDIDGEGRLGPDLGADEFTGNFQTYYLPIIWKE